MLLQKNFSDYATGELVRPIRGSIVCEHSRAIGDPNRERNKAFHHEDFSKNKVWRFKIPYWLQEFLLRRHYDKYHNKVRPAVKDKKYVFDVHDTGNVMMKKNSYHIRNPRFPKLCLSNDDHRTSTKEEIQLFAELLEKEFGYKPTINDPYKGGYVTRTYGKNRTAIQIELGRYLYMDEHTQEIDEKKLADVREKLLTAIEKFSLQAPQHPQTQSRS